MMGQTVQGIPTWEAPSFICMTEKMKFMILFPHGIGPDAWGILIVDYLHPDFKSDNYATKVIAEAGKLKLLSRNSSSVTKGNIYLTGAFSEFDKKPYLFPVETLLDVYKGSEDKMEALYQDFKALIEVVLELEKNDAGPSNPPTSH